MAALKEITAMCRAGQLIEAYAQAKADVETRMDDVWAQRSLGWVLYYRIKNAVEKNEFDAILSCLEELRSLQQLTVSTDGMMYEKVLFAISSFVRNKILVTDETSSEKLSLLFEMMKGYTFAKSKSYSFLLQSVIKHDTWGEMADFIEWWNLENLMPEDFEPYEIQKGRAMMSLAERVYINYSKNLLKQKDTERIQYFLLHLNQMVDTHPEMVYLGYYCGKLLLAVGRNQGEALNVLLPFARKKSTDFWVWTLLADVFKANQELQMACLMRAAHCKTQETFLGKVRLQLASLYIQNKQYNKARYHIDKIVDCYNKNNWQLPSEVYWWTREPWINKVNPDSSEALDYMSITNDILCDGCEEAVAVVTYVDSNSNRVAMVYGDKLRMMQKLRIKVGIGDALSIKYIIDSMGKPKLLQAVPIERFPQNLPYAKKFNGVVDRRPDKPFAFVKGNSERYFINPALVQKYDLQNAQSIRVKVACDYDKKKDEWRWACIKICKC